MVIIIKDEKLYIVFVFIKMDSFVLHDRIVLLFDRTLMDGLIIGGNNKSQITISVANFQAAFVTK